MKPDIFAVTLKKILSELQLSDPPLTRKPDPYIPTLQPHEVFIAVYRSHGYHVDIKQRLEYCNHIATFRKELRNRIEEI